MDSLKAKLQTIFKKTKNRREAKPNRSFTDSTKVKINTNKVSTIEIIDLNIDCLEHIFGFLKMEDLLNVTDAQKIFKPIAERVIARKYLKKETIIKLNISQNTRDRLHIRSMNFIMIQDLKTSLQLLRSFGHFVLELHVLYTKDVKKSEELLRYIYEYCKHLENDKKCISQVTLDLRQLLGHAKGY